MTHLIEDLAVLLLVSLPINLLFHKIKLPSVIGYLIAGVLIGPYGMQLIEDLESVKHIAEVGVILLLFVIGLEFSLARLLKNLVSVLGVGGFQLILTSCAVAWGLSEYGFPKNQSIAFGLIVALSSTAIVLKMLTDLAEIDTIQGRLCIGTLLFQDICVVPIMLVMPLLAQSTTTSPIDFFIAMFESVVAVIAIFFLSKLIVPRTLTWVARTGNKEHLTLFVIFIILITGWLSQKMGLTLAMGALIAGMIISDSEYNHQIILDILPLRDYFSSIFFISIGMLLQIQVFFDSAYLFLGLTATVILIKIVLSFLSCVLVRTSLRISMVVGMRLAQVGEFSLILAAIGLEQGLFNNVQYQYLLIVSILSMLVAPFLIQISTKFSIWFFSRVRSEEPEEKEKDTFSDHVIISGYGLGGRTLAKVLQEANIPFLILELNGEKIKRALKEGCSANYGDCTQQDTLLRAGIKKAKMIVYAITDQVSTERAVRLTRKLNPKIKIIVRTRLFSQVEELKEAGANEVIPEEFETSIEIFCRVLKDYRIPNNVIEQQVELIRLEGYSMLRGLSLNSESLKKFSTYLTASLTESYMIIDGSWVCGKNLADINFNLEANIIAVVRDNKSYPNPGPEFSILAGDMLILFGSHIQLNNAIKYLQEGS